MCTELVSEVLCALVAAYISVEVVLLALFSVEVLRLCCSCFSLHCLVLRLCCLVLRLCCSCFNLHYFMLRLCCNVQAPNLNICYDNQPLSNALASILIEQAVWSHLTSADAPRGVVLCG